MPVEYRLGDPILLCAACRVARYDPASDPPDNEGPIRARISKSKAKEQFKLADRDLIGLEHGPRGYFYSDVRDVARRLHGGDVGIRAVVGFSNERKKQLRETRLEKQQERERIAVENRKRRRTALQERLDQLGLQIPETNTIYRSFVDGYSLYGAPPRNRGRLFDSATDPQFQDTVNRLGGFHFRFRLQCV